MNEYKKTDIEISQYTEEGYKALVDYDRWRVAVLNYIDELEPENIDNVQKHDETDEVFVLLEGNCILITATKTEDSFEFNTYNMEPLKLYNIKKGIYHTHTLSKDGKVLIVENRNTTDENSPKIILNKEERHKLARKIWQISNF